MGCQSGHINKKRSIVFKLVNETTVVLHNTPIVTNSLIVFLSKVIYCSCGIEGSCNTMKHSCNIVWTDTADL